MMKQILFQSRHMQKKLIGKTFADVCREDDITKSTVVREASNYEVKHANKKRKGGLGELIEERFFHYQTNNDARPDFDKIGRASCRERV